MLKRNEFSGSSVCQKAISPVPEGPFLDYAQDLISGPCWVDLCFGTSDDGIDGSGRCFLEYEDTLHTTDRIILTESERTEERQKGGRCRVTCRGRYTLIPYLGILRPTTVLQCTVS